MRTRKAFIFSPLPVYPVVRANQKDIHGHIELFRQLGFDTTLFHIHDPKRDSDAASERIDVPTKAIRLGVAVNHRPNRYTYWTQARATFSESTLKSIQQEMDLQEPDVLFFEYADFAYLANFLRRRKSRMLFRAHNFELIHNYEKHAVNRNRGAFNYLRMLRYGYKTWYSIYCCERLMFKIANKVLSISYGDCQSFKSWYGATNIVYFPPYLTDILSVYKVRERQQLNVLYMGSYLTNPPNARGAVYLLEEIVPRVNRKWPSSFVFHITGKHPEVLDKCRKESNVKIHGFVSDINSFLMEMDVAILPVKAGRGCKIKMFECLASGIPTIGFKKTFYGIPWREGCYETAETPRGFVRALERMLLPDHRKRLSDNSRGHIQNIADSRMLLERLERCIDESD